MGKKYSTEEIYFKRLQELAKVPTSKEKLNETKGNTLGELINFERGADKVAYGIVKENHNYYIKKSNSQKNPLVEDFAYIGGLSNIKEYQFESLAKASKRRNMFLLTISEAFGEKPIIAETVTEKQQINEAKKEEKSEDKKEDKKPKEKKVDKKEDKSEDKKEDKVEDKSEDKKEDKVEDKKDDVNEDVSEDAGEEIEKAEKATADLEVATEKEKEDDVELDVNSVDLPPADDETPPADDETPPADDDINIDDINVDAIDPEATDVDAIDPDASVDGIEGGDASAEGDEDLNIGIDELSDENKEIEQLVGKVTNKVRKSEMTPAETKGFVNSYLSAFQDKIKEVEIEDRKEMANKILKVVPDEEIDALDVGQETEVAEQQCDECGFAKYVSERGYNSDSIMECGIDEMTNLMSGYVMETGELTENDYAGMANFTSEAIETSLEEDYGHAGISEAMKPFANLNEVEDNESKKSKIKGMFWWEINPTKIGGKDKVNEDDEVNEMGVLGSVASGIGNTISNVKDKISGGLTEEQIQEMTPLVSGVLKERFNLSEEDLNEVAPAIIGAIGQALDTKGGQEVGRGVGDALGNLTKEGIGQAIDNLSGAMAGRIEKKGIKGLMREVTDDGNDPASIEVQPNLDDNNYTDDTTEISGDITDNANAVDLTPGFENMGISSISPESSDSKTIDVNVNAQQGTVDITMNESEVKFRKYIKNRLEEKFGLKKPRLTENKKSDKIKRLDKMIDEQISLLESVVDEVDMNKLRQVGKQVGRAVTSATIGLQPKQKIDLARSIQNPNDPNLTQVFTKVFSDILSDKTGPRGTVINRALPAVKAQDMYEAIKQLEQNAGIGSLVPGGNSVVFSKQPFKGASQFKSGGTQGQTNYGGMGEEVQE
jgi:hypothetical protein